MKTIRNIAVGIDFGNSEICVTLFIPSSGKKGEPAQKLTMSMPTAFASVDINKFNNLGIDLKDALFIRMVGESTQWGIGHVALAQSKRPWNGQGDVYRYASEHFIRAILAMVAKMIPDEEFNVFVVSGLPAEIYINNPGNLRSEIRKAVIGPKPSDGTPREKTYKFTIDGKTMRTCTIKDYPTTVMEGAGVVFGYASKDTIGPAGVAVIDIGGRTTDLYVARGGQPVFDLCKGYPIGVVSISDHMSSAFHERYGFPLTQLEMRSILYAYAANHPIPVTTPQPIAQNEEAEPQTMKRGKKKAVPTKVSYPVISQYGVTIPESEIEAMVQEAVSNVTEALISFVRSSWNESDSSIAIAARFKPVLGAGGGMHFFFLDLKKKIRHLQMVTEPTFANSDGYGMTALKALTAYEAREQERKKAAVLSSTNTTTSQQG